MTAIPPSVSMLQSSSRYETEAVAAVYLEAEWSDILLGQAGVPALPLVDPTRQNATPSFYLKIAELCALACRDQSLSPGRILEVGSATGRTIYELTGKFEDVSAVFALEPSRLLHEWSRRLLIHPPSTLAVPTVGNWNSPGSTVVEFFSIRRMLDPQKLQILNCTLEQFDETIANFDLVVCCNLLDRHPAPRALVMEIHRRLRPGGLLVLSSPLEFGIHVSDSFTDTASSVADFLPSSSWEIISTTEVPYDLRLYIRKWVRYISQVVVAIRK